MSQFFHIHPDNPQLRLVRQAGKLIEAGAIAALPTDACYVLVCRLDDKAAMERLRRIRGVDDKHHLTLLCRDLSEIASYAQVDNSQYRLLKAATPGPYTFILRASKEVPRRLCHPARKTIGLRVPNNPIACALLEALKQPLVGTTLILPNEILPMTDPQQIQDALAEHIELVIDGGASGLEPTTVIDLTGSAPVLLRQGCGATGLFGF